MTPPKPTNSRGRSAWVAAALWGSASLSAQAVAQDLLPLPSTDTAEAPPVPAYGVRPQPEPRPVSEPALLQGLWLSQPPLGGTPPDPPRPVQHLSIDGERLYQRDPTSGRTGEQGKVTLLWEISEGTSRSIQVRLTERVIDGVAAPDVEERWDLTIYSDGSLSLMRGGVPFAPAPPPPPAPAYGIAPPIEEVKKPPKERPKPVYGGPPPSDRKLKFD